jgi:hypothetical protein
MRNLLLLVVLVSVGWYAYGKYQPLMAANAAEEPISVARPVPLTSDPGSANVIFKCDGRTYCSQMTSCAEATYFLRNCPGTKMDGNNDGVPCEQQWCK